MTARSFLTGLIVAYSIACILSQETCPENEEWRKCEPLQFRLDCDDTCMGIKQTACLEEACLQAFVTERGDCRCKAGMVRRQIVGGRCIPQEQCHK
uniref:TIL domain-containing protein n=1 Tax=Plectus sambesii TaxID=2011161 RepID=A0A914X2E3_9BILA